MNLDPEGHWANAQTRAPHHTAWTVDELVQVIKDAESWLQTGEGVGLTYYHDDFFCEKEATDTRSKEIIEQILAGDKDA